MMGGVPLVAIPASAGPIEHDDGPPSLADGPYSPDGEYGLRAVNVAPWATTETPAGSSVVRSVALSEPTYPADVYTPRLRCTIYTFPLSESPHEGTFLPITCRLHTPEFHGRLSTIVTDDRFDHSWRTPKSGGWRSIATASRCTRSSA
jgi:hypothetical protein